MAEISIVNDARQLYLDAQFTGAAVLLKEQSSVEAKLLLARALIRSKQLDAADLALASLPVKSLDIFEVAELAVLQFAVSIRRSSGAQVVESRAHAKTLVEHLGSFDLESEFWLNDSFYAHATEDLARCERSAWNAVHTSLTLAPSRSHNRMSVSPFTANKASALLMISLVRGKQGKFHEQIRFNREAVVTLKQVSPVDLWSLAYCHANFGFIIRDFGSIDDLIALELVDTSSWPSSLEIPALEIERSRAWLYALKGEDKRSKYLFKSLAARCDDRRDGYWLAFLADLATITFDLSNGRDNTDLSDAAVYAENFDWAKHSGQRFALGIFARALSSTDPARALNLVALNERIDEISSAVDSDIRVIADRAFSSGIVFMRLSRFTEARQSLVRAFDIWFQLGQRWQAINAAIDISLLPGADDYYRRYARHEATMYPNSWLSLRIAEIGNLSSF